jgi:N-methylhydantoinase A
VIDDLDWIGSTAERSLFDPVQGRFKDAAIFERDQVAVGKSLSGPAVIVENETTIIVPAGRFATCQPDGCIDVRAKGA